MRRFHRAHALFQPTACAAQLRELVRDERLLVARYEPAMRQMDVTAGIDLIFGDGNNIAVVPFVHLDRAMLVEPEDDPLIWPQSVAESVEEDALIAIGRIIQPWLYAASLAGHTNTELIRFFDPSFAQTFDRGRAYGFLGAASYGRVIEDAAPCVYALRFATGKNVAIEYPGGATGAAILARHAKNVQADLKDPARNDLARSWYNAEWIGKVHEQADRDVVVSDSADLHATVEIRVDAVPEGFMRVPIAPPIPFAVEVSFDQADGIPQKFIGISVCDKHLPRRARFGYAPDPVGGSAGRILIGVRKDAHQAPDADIDDAHELARRLRGEGFAVDVVSNLARVDPAAYDLVHVFGLLAPDEACWLLGRARAANRPAVVTPMLEDVTLRGVWGAGVTQQILSMTCDERDLSTYLQHLGAHNLSTPIYAAGKRHEPRAGFEEAVRKALALVDVVLVSGPAEDELVKERYGATAQVRMVAPYLNTSTPFEPIGHIAPAGDFVLAHAPMEPRCNQALLARAMRDAGLPLVLLGPVTDASYLELVREQAGDQIVFVPAATPGEIAALYARARVYADVAWFGMGLGRAARAAAYGGALAIANLRYAGALWRPGLWEIEPASVPSIAHGVAAAWNAVRDRPLDVAACGSRIAASTDPVASLVATVSAYAHAQQARLNFERTPAEI